MKQIKILHVVSSVLLLTAVVYGQTDNYSVANGGASGLLGDDVLTRTPVPPSMNFPGAGLGFEVDAISQGMNEDLITGYQFSVDQGSLGIAGAVLAEAAASDQQADIYQSAGTGSNTLLYDGDGSTAPTLGLLEQPMADDVDGWENDAFSGSIYFSYNVLAAPPPALGTSGADIYRSFTLPGYDSIPPATPYAFAGMLGLDMSGLATDDIDALVVFDNGDGVWNGTDFILFSLTRTSMAFSNGSAYNGANAADILIATASGAGNGIFTPAASLGLNGATDNIDALDVIPEPSTLMLMLVAGGGIGLYRRIRPKY